MLKARGDLYQQWEDQMEEEAVSSDGKLVILELGCGTRVKSIRQECECVYKDAADRGASVTLVRVNPSDDPNLDKVENDVTAEDDSTAEGRKCRFLRLRMTALEALRAIEDRLQKQI
eukprot:TRINITY_DN39481_c0_g1_i2.p1 TRINITY_DN39481_c0_g1~~TRINITY_DN39481_c0_g1_i2.p1  ORF type:complete len:117 (+),score=32.71 TRINITY_DN39481_c0_g1_i2:239-589(+)